MKITHLIFAFNTGGSETMLVDIVNEQCNYAEISIIIINNKYNQSLIKKIDKSVKVYYINRKEGSKNLFKLFKINLLVLKIKPDILHCHNHNIIALLFRKIYKKIVLTLHCLDIPTLYLNRYKKLFAISEAVKKNVFIRTNICSEVVYNGIITSKISERNKQELEKDFKIVIVGRLNHQIKGQHLVIEALKVLKNKGYENIQLDLIGEGEGEQFLFNLAERNNLLSQVEFLGLKDRDYIYSHLKDYDLLIQPSLYEGFGLTVAEGMAAKLPVLVSDVDGPMEVIENGKCGYYFGTGNANSLATMIEKVMTDYKTNNIQTLVDRAYVRVTNQFDIKETAMSYLSNYKLLIKKKDI